MKQTITTAIVLEKIMEMNETTIKWLAEALHTTEEHVSSHLRILEMYGKIEITPQQTIKATE